VPQTLQGRSGVSSIDNFINSIRGKGLSVVLPEGDDDRVMRAARRMVDEDIARPVLIASESDFEQVGISSDGIRLVDPATSDRAEHYTDMLLKARAKLDRPTATKLVAKRLYFAALMAKAGDVDTFVAGAVYPTGRVIEAGLRCVGLDEGIRTASSFFLMALPDFNGEGPRTLFYADCAVVIDPTVDQLADITISSAKSAGALLDEPPRIAMLSFSSHGSAKHDRIDKITEALAQVRERDDSILIDGELQADTALMESVATRKVTSPSDVAGRANVLIFPDLDSGNISYKLTQYLAGAQAIGPILQGFSLPISDLSRGASVDDIVGVTAVCLAQVR